MLAHEHQNIQVPNRTTLGFSCATDSQGFGAGRTTQGSVVLELGVKQHTPDQTRPDHLIFSFKSGILSGFSSDFRIVLLNFTEPSILNLCDL